MLRRCIVRFVAPLTQSVATNPLSTRFRRSAVAFQKMAYRKIIRKDAVRKARSARGKLIAEKTAAMKEQLANTTNARDILIAQLADQIFSRGHEFHSTATNITYVPDGNPATPEIVLVGRSQSGKSSLLRSLFRESRAVGRGNTLQRRDGVNFYSVGGGVFNIADTPGFGGTSVPWSAVLQSAILVRNYVRCRPNLKMMYYVMDANTSGGVYIQDLDLLKFFSSEVPNFTIVLTKADRLPSAVGHHRFRDTKQFNVLDIKKELLRNDIEHPMLVTSAYEMGGIDTLRYDITMHVVHSLPSEALTLTEARKLSDRLFTQDELASVRRLSIPPTDVDEAIFKWKLDVTKEHAEAAANSLLIDAGHQELNASGNEPQNSTKTGVQADAVTQAGTSAVVHKSDIPPYQRLLSKLNNEALMKKVHETSPWRNPLLWPANVVPTKHPRKNIMRCPQDPDNPYLSQAHFVAPRADMNFRRPNVGFRRCGKKGKYEPDDPRVALQNTQFTIPFFPDIVDVRMLPKPWMFLGSKEHYYERPGGRSLGIRLARYAQQGMVDPLSDTPSSDNPLLNAEVRRLELAAASGFERQRLAIAAPDVKKNVALLSDAGGDRVSATSQCVAKGESSPRVEAAVRTTPSSKIRHIKPQ
jgi:GTP-binding protein EngB required for normal cell division